MKRTMKSIGMLLTAMVFTLLLSQHLQAQEQMRDHRPPMLPDSAHIVKMVDRMAGELSLSDQQKATLMEMNLAHFKEVRGIVEQDRAARENTHEKLEVMRKQFERQMESVLNDQQKEQFKKFLEMHRPPREEHPEHE
jgi:hypothetical protein